MLLVITKSRDVTADYLCGRLAEHAIEFRRLDTDGCLERISLSYSISTPILRYGTEEWAAGDFTNVWFRRPLPLTLGIEMEDAERAHTLAEWSEALEGFLGHIPLEAWMNHPSLNVRASHKMEQLSRAAKFGLVVPPTIVSQDAEWVRSFFWDECDGRMIVKPLASGYLERQSPSDDTVIYANRVSESELNAWASCPAVPRSSNGRLRSGWTFAYVSSMTGWLRRAWSPMRREFRFSTSAGRMCGT